MTREELAVHTGQAIGIWKAAGIHAICYLWEDEDNMGFGDCVASTEHMRIVDDHYVGAAVYRIIQESNLPWEMVLEAMRRIFQELNGRAPHA